MYIFIMWKRCHNIASTENYLNGVRNKRNLHEYNRNGQTTKKELSCLN